jgi:hypothetical protein
MALSGRTISLLSKPFDGGMGPSHSSIELIWAEAGAEQSLPEEGNKVQRVMGGLKALAARANDPLNPQASRQLEQVVSGLATRLMMQDDIDSDQLDAALTKDGFATYQGEVVSNDEPVDRLAASRITCRHLGSSRRTATSPLRHRPDELRYRKAGLTDESSAIRPPPIAANRFALTSAGSISDSYLRAGSGPLAGTRKRKKSHTTSRTAPARINKSGTSTARAALSAHKGRGADYFSQTRFKIVWVTNHRRPLPFICRSNVSSTTVRRTHCE